MAITVRYGTCIKMFNNLANKTVAQIRCELAGHMELGGSDSRATVNNVDVGEDQVVQDFQTVEFEKRQGSKGSPKAE